MKQKERIPDHRLPLKKYDWLIHTVAWGILSFLPFIFMGRDTEKIAGIIYVRIALVLLSFIILFYANYFCLVKRYVFTKQMGRYVAANLLLIVSLGVLVHVAGELFPIPPDRTPPYTRPDGGMHYINILRLICINLISYSFVAALSVAFKMTGSWYAAEAERREMERNRSEAELQNLKNQLNPHFLFNTLNNIYSLAALSPERTQEAIHDLSHLLRYVMYESSQPLVPLEKELDFIRNYVELMRIRLPGHVELQTEITLVAPGTLIAPLLFISLIENAFKHGVSNNKPSFIRIRIFQEGNKVVSSTLNSDFHKDAGRDKSGSGIGLVNLEKRLSLLYPGKYVFRHGNEDGNYRTYLSITINDTGL
jgi:hypothetical protein